MSRIGRQPIKIPSGVDCKSEGQVFKVKGPKGQLERNLHANMKIEIDDGEVRVIRPTDGRIDRSLHGLTRTLINNMVVGVTQGFTKQLNIVGVGYKVELKGKNLTLSGIRTRSNTRPLVASSSRWTRKKIRLLSRE
jgi:large subunit ribosomal protein L6